VFDFVQETWGEQCPCDGSIVCTWAYDVHIIFGLGDTDVFYCMLGISFLFCNGRTMNNHILFPKSVFLQPTERERERERASIKPCCFWS